MFDFKISNTGDLVLDNAENIAKTKIRFGISDYPVLNINFMTNKISEKKEENPEILKIAFSVNKTSKKTAPGSVYDTDELRQRIMILLRTEYGSIPVDQEFGSYINTMRHEDITNDGVLNRIRNIVEEEIAGILDNPSVEVRRVITNEIFGSQNINVYIFDNNKPVYEFTMEEL